MNTWTTAWLLALTLWGAWVRYKQYKNAQEIKAGFEYWGGSQHEVVGQLRDKISKVSGTVASCDGAIVSLHDTLSQEVLRLEEKIAASKIVKEVPTPVRVSER